MTKIGGVEKLLAACYTIHTIRSHKTGKNDTFFDPPEVHEFYTNSLYIR
jgi:hypothetical protein